MFQLANSNEASTFFFLEKNKKYVIFRIYFLVIFHNKAVLSNARLILNGRIVSETLEMNLK